MIATPKLHLQPISPIVRWSIFTVLILSYILVYFHRMAPGAVASELMAAFDTSGTSLGTLSAIYFAVYAFMQLPSGVLADTLGTRTLVTYGNLVAGIGSICFGLASSFEIACLGRFLVGLGVSVVFVSIMKSNSVWFHERMFALLSGVTLLIGNLGSVLAAAPLSAMMSVVAWRTIFLAIGIFALLLAVIGHLVIRNRPEDLGYKPANTYLRRKVQADSTWLQDLLAVVTTPAIWPGFFVQFGMVGGLYAVMGLWGIPFLMDVHQLARPAAASHLTVMLLSFAFGALLFGWLSDHLGKRKPLIIGSVSMYTLAMVALIYTSWLPGWQAMGLFALLGFSGSGFVLTFAAAKEVIDPDRAGMAVSVVNTGCFAGTALMQPLFGYIADQTWDGTMAGGSRVYAATDYHNSLLMLFIFALVALVSCLLIKETGGRNITVD